MSDTTRTLVWIVLALVVIALISWLWMSWRRREEAAQRAEATALRSQVEERLTTVRDQEDRASVTEQIAADARAEAEAQAVEARRVAAAAAEQQAEARRLAEAAEAHRAEALAAREEHERLAREADRLDPDVATDSEGYRLDDTGHRLDGSDPGEEETRAEAAPVGTKRVAEQPDASGQAEAGASVVPTEASDEEAVPMEDVTNDTARETGPRRAADENPADERAAQERATEERATEERATEERATDDQATDARGDYRFSSGDAEDEAVVRIPALEDRDEVVVGGGTPDDDPGDQRGQPWSTSPGQPGPDPADEEPGAGYGEDAALGARVDPDTDVEVGEPATNPGPVEHSDDAPLLDDSAGTDEGDREEGAPEEGVHDHADRTESARDEGSAQTTVGDGVVGGRRISEFDEVVDGGYGIGSAAPIADGAQPLGHAVKARRDGMTYVLPDAAGYDDVEPDLWFYNEESARRAGFTAEGE